VNNPSYLKVAKDLKPTEMRVLLVMLSAIQYNNMITISQKEIAEILDIDSANVSRSVKGLLKGGFLVEHPSPNRTKVYQLSPRHFWRGNISAHYSEIAALDKQESEKTLRVIEGGRGQKTQSERIA